MCQPNAISMSWNLLSLLLSISLHIFVSLPVIHDVSTDQYILHKCIHYNNMYQPSTTWVRDMDDATMVGTN